MSDKYRKKPIEIRAHKWEHDGLLSEWSSKNEVRQHIAFRAGKVEISTLEGVMTADHGDWLIIGIKGELYPCKPAIFAASYDHVDCGGLRRVNTECDDRNCGDSTWDHECGLGAKDCDCAPLLKNET